LLNYLLGILTGVFIGAAGGYFAAKFTDVRRNRESGQKRVPTSTRPPT